MRKVKPGHDTKEEREGRTPAVKGRKGRSKKGRKVWDSKGGNEEGYKGVRRDEGED